MHWFCIAASIMWRIFKLWLKLYSLFKLFMYHVHFSLHYLKFPHNILPRFSWYLKLYMYTLHKYACNIPILNELQLFWLICFCCLPQPMRDYQILLALDCFGNTWPIAPFVEQEHIFNTACMYKDDSLWDMEENL